jgi:hypothetical protein
VCSAYLHAAAAAALHNSLPVSVATVVVARGACEVLYKDGSQMTSLGG